MMRIHLHRMLRMHLHRMVRMNLHRMRQVHRHVHRQVHRPRWRGRRIPLSLCKRLCRILRCGRAGRRWIIGISLNDRHRRFYPGCDDRRVSLVLVANGKLAKSRRRVNLSFEIQFFSNFLKFVQPDICLLFEFRSRLSNGNHWR